MLLKIIIQNNNDYIFKFNFNINFYQGEFGSMYKRSKKYFLLGMSFLTITSTITSAIVLNTNKNTSTKTSKQNNVIGTISSNNQSNNSISTFTNLMASTSNSNNSNVNELNNISIPAHIFSNADLKTISSNLNDINLNVSSNSSTNQKFNSFVSSEESKIISYIQNNGLQTNGFTNILENQLDLPSSFVNENIISNTNISLSYTSYLYQWINWNSKYWLKNHSLQDTIQAFDDISSLTPWKFVKIEINNTPIKESYYYHFLKSIALTNVSDGSYDILLSTQPGIDITLNNYYINDGDYKIKFVIQDSSNSINSNTNSSNSSSSTNSTNNASSQANSQVTTLSNEISEIETQVSNDESNYGSLNYTTMTEQRLLAWEESEYVKTVTNNGSYSTQAFNDWNTMNGYYHHEFSWWDITNRTYYYKQFESYINDITNIYNQSVTQYNEQFETPLEILSNEIIQTQNQLSEEEAISSDLDSNVMTEQRLLAWYQCEYIKYVTKDGSLSTEAFNDWNIMNGYYHYTLNYYDITCRLYWHSYFMDYIKDIYKIYDQESISYNLTPNSSLSTLNDEINELSPIVQNEEKNGQYILNKTDMDEARMLALYECEYIQAAGYTSTSVVDFSTWKLMDNYYNLTLKGMSDWNKETPWYFTQFCLYLKEIQSSYNTTINPYSTGLNLMQKAIETVNRYASEEYGVAIASSVATAISIALAAAYWAGSWFFGITVPEAVTATTAAISTATAMAGMWTSYKATQTVQQEIENDSFSWMSIKSDKKFYKTMKKDWKKFRKYFTKTYKSITKITKAISAIESATADACSWADPILLIVNSVDLALCTSVMLSNMVINAVETTWLNTIFLI